MTSYSIKNVGVVEKLDRLEKDMQDLKSRQFVGRKVLATKKVYENKRHLSVDYYGFPPAAPVGSNVYRTVTYTAATQLNPYARLLIELYDLSGARIDNLSSTGSDGPKLFTYNFIVTYVDDQQLKWAVDIRGPVTPKFYVQFSVAASDVGILTSVPYVP